MDYQNKPVLLMDDIYVIDGMDMNMPNRTSIYVITEEALTLIGTGPSPSVKQIKAGLQQLGYALQDVQYVILTHANLDHAGGIGLLIRECIHAKIVVHPEAVDYLLNPRKVAAITRAMYGDSFTDFFDPIGKVYPEDILTKQHGEKLEIGPNYQLEFIDTPGHVNHHFTVYQREQGLAFTGNIAGIRYHHLAQSGVDLYLPFTPPNQFQPEEMKQSLRVLQKLNINHIFYGHYGMTSRVEQALNQVQTWLALFLEVAEKVVDKKGTYEDVMNQLQLNVANELRQQGVSTDHDIFLLINLDLYMSALGLIDYFQDVKQ